MVFNLKSIAIIGGGPSGIAALTELLNTSESGESTISKSTTELPTNPAFNKVVLFEQNSDFGGVWNYSAKPDPSFPSQEVLETGKYNTPEIIRPTIQAPSDDKLGSSTFEHPVDAVTNVDRSKIWSNSAAYDNLFTNVPKKFLSFSFEEDHNVSDGLEFRPFAKHSEIKNYLLKVVARYNLEKYTRFNSAVEKVIKRDNKWIVTIAKYDPNSGNTQWYNEEFDAVVVASGQDNVPYIPLIKGLAQFNKLHPGVFLHTKSFRNTHAFKDKKILLVGGSISSADILQYLVPVGKSVHVSRTSIEKDIWFARSFDAAKLIKHPGISKFIPESNSVEFDDGTVESDFDKIIFATGYHIHYPFLSSNDQTNLLNVTSGLTGNENYAKKKVNNSFLYSFSISDPTFATVGIAHNLFKFISIEASSIAIAGVWSNFKKLPSKEDQVKWVENRVKDRTKGFQFDQVTDVAELLLNDLVAYAPRGRPIDFVKDSDPNELLENQKVLDGVFDKLVSGELSEYYGSA